MKVTTKPTSNSSKAISQLVAQGMIDKKATNVVIMDLRHIPQAVADYFVIASANSGTQVDAIADSIEEVVYLNSGEHPRRREGKTQKEWVLLDYVDVVAHIFRTERREFYDIENLWGDAKFTRL